MIAFLRKSDSFLLFFKAVIGYNEIIERLEGGEIVKLTYKMFITVQYINLNKQMIKRHLQDWLVFIRLLYQPEQMIVNHEKIQSFSLKKVHHLLNHLTEQEDLEFIVKNGPNESYFHLVDGNLLEKHLISQDIFLTNQQMILNYIEVKMSKRGLFGYIRSYDEYLYHNTDEIEMRQVFQPLSEIEKLPKIRNKENETVVDCNQFAGYDIFYRGFCLTSCWRIYFTSRYHKIIPLAVLEEVQQVEQVTKTAEDVWFVELYKDPYRWQEDLNLGYQRLFRDQMGIDQLAWDNGVGILREPLIEYAYTDNIIQTVQYQNDRLQPTPKKNATHFVTRVFDIVHGNYQEKRVKGVLNAQAYFPWIDEQGMKMMNYLVLNPQYSLDEGFCAYEFYLRNYLEINVTDERYHEYLAILTIYLPDDFLAKVPYKVLKEEMKDVHFTRLKKRKQRVYFDIKKGENHLRVNFVGFSAMKNTNEIIHVGG